MLILQLARELIELSGLSPNRDIQVKITGLKQGEKLSEQLVDNDAETLHATSLHKINSISTLDFDTAAFARKLRVLETAAWDDNTAEVHRWLADFGIGFVYHSPVRLWPVNPRSVASAGIPVKSGIRISTLFGQPESASD